MVVKVLKNSIKLTLRQMIWLIYESVKNEGKLSNASCTDIELPIVYRYLVYILSGMLVLR